LSVVRDFNNTPLSASSKRQLNTIARRAANQTAGSLAEWIYRNGFDVPRGIYVPLSPDVWLLRKLPDVSCALAAPHGKSSAPLPCFFTNALLIPAGYGTADFNPDEACPPRLRAVNPGLLFVTLEFDSQEVQQLDEQLGWARSASSKGEFSSTPLSEVHQELSRLREYRGISAVYSGSKSVHCHFLFSTEHLINAPYDALADKRTQNFEAIAALMANVHELYWNHVHDVFVSVLTPSLPADPRLRSLSQWRRAPGAIRRLTEGDRSLLDFPADTLIPQLVLRENILDRAPKGNAGFLVPETFSRSNPVPKPKKVRASTADTGYSEDEQSEMLVMLQETCRSEWGEWPKPVGIRDQNGDWLFKFQNHKADRTPSTVCLGGHRKLLLNGRHGFGEQAFYLPDRLSANELGEHLALRLGYRQPKRGEDASSPVVTLSDRKIAAKEYREHLSWGVAQIREPEVANVVRTPEGLGKSTVLANVVMREAREEATNKADDVQRFAAFACRSKKQAADKAHEFSGGYPAVVIRTFRDHYEECCEAEKLRPIPLEDMDEATPTSVLARIKREQPRVYERLEHQRKALWAEARFDAGTTILCMTHRAAEVWHASILTRAWHHPEFNPEASRNEHAALRDRFRLNRIVFDDCEMDDFIHLFPEAAYEFLSRQQGRHKDWRNIPRRKRLMAYRAIRATMPNGWMGGFDSFDELMRLDLEGLEPICVDFDAIPFGFDRNADGIYRQQHGERFFIGTKPWLHENPGEFTFLTTETLVTAVAEVSFKKLASRQRGREVRKLILEDAPPIFPVKVPLVFDTRARADRKGSQQISALVSEIIGKNPEALVIADGVRDDVAGVQTFQGMKGRNEFRDRDVYIIPTCLAPAKYAQLNVIGQWLGRRDVIGRYYDDQINQAVGRNRGFRQSEVRETVTQVICSKRLWTLALEPSNATRRSMLYLA
jgi:hypothetical protein